MSRLLLAATILLGFPPFVANAHHSYAEFDDQQIVEIEGTLTTARWQNPHARLIVQTSDGRDFEIETAPASYLLHSNAPLDLYTVGSSVKVAGWPSKRSNVRMYGTNILSSSGQELVLWRAPPRWQDAPFVASRAAPSAAESRAAPKTLFQVWGSLYANATQPDDPDASPRSLNRVAMPYTEAGRSAMASVPSDDAVALGCNPKGMWFAMSAPNPMEIVDQGDTILLRSEEYDTVRTFHMDGGKDPATQPVTPLGYSVGRWEGDMLVVETTRLGGGWMAFGPDARLVERFTLGDDDGRLHYSILISDPRILTQPVEQKRSWVATPGVKLLPFDCKPFRE